MGLVNDVPILVGLWLYERGGGEEKEELRMFACDCHELHDRTRWVHQYVHIVALHGHACPYFRKNECLGQK